MQESALSTLRYVHPMRRWDKDFEEAHAEIWKDNVVQQIKSRLPKEGYQDTFEQDDMDLVLMETQRKFSF